VHYFNNTKCKTYRTFMEHLYVRALKHWTTARMIWRSAFPG